MHILVTGGAGYLGSTIVPALLQKGHSVTVLDTFLYEQTSLLACCRNSNFEIVKGDCRDQALLQKLVSKADAVIPLAALVGVPVCTRDATAAVTVNRDAIKLLADLLSPSQLLLYPTTNSGYGIGQDGISCTEDTPLRPISLYGRTKVEAESIVMGHRQAVCFRLATAFGVSPRMRLDLLVNDFVYRALNDRAIVVFEGHFKRNYVHVLDIADAFLFALNNIERLRGNVYNLGLSDANLSKLELCAKIKEHLPGFVYLEAPVGKDPDQRNYIVSNAKIEAAGFAATRSLDYGIRELLSAYSMLSNVRYGNNGF